MGNGEAEKLVCMTHGHELRWGKCLWEGEYKAEGNKGKKKTGATVIA